jgi:hypothetical protein
MTRTRTSLGGDALRWPEIDPAQAKANESAMSSLGWSLMGGGYHRGATIAQASVTYGCRVLGDPSLPEPTESSIEPQIANPFTRSSIRKIDNNQHSTNLKSAILIRE